MRLLALAQRLPMLHEELVRRQERAPPDAQSSAMSRAAAYVFG